MLPATDATPAAPSAAPSDVLASLSPKQYDAWRMTGEVPGASYVGDPPATPADPPSADPDAQEASTEVDAKPASEPGTPSSQTPTKGKAARLKTLDADIQAKLKERHDLDTELETRRRALADVKPTAPSPVTAPATQDDPEPDHTDATKFPEGQYDLGYIKAMAKWEARQEFRQQSASADQRRRAETLEQVSQRTQATFASEVKAAIDADPTFGELLSTSEAEVPADPTHPMTHVIMTSTAKIAFLRHFAEHPEDATRLAAMASRDPQSGQWRGNPMGLYGEMKKLEGRLEALGTPPPASSPKTVSSAPPPPPTLGTRATAPVDEIEAAIARKDFATFDRLESARVIARAAGR